MIASDERILTTHAGSLPRTGVLTDLLLRREQRKPFDPAVFDREVDRALDLAVGKQLACGIDIGNDGEMPRIGFSTYVAERMSGFGGESQRRTPVDMVKFPGYAAFMSRQLGVTENLARVWNAPQAQGAVHYDDTLSGVKAECEAFSRCLDRQDQGFAEVFMTAASPGIVTTTLLRAEDNPAYPADRDYVLGVAQALKKEYDYVVSQGYILQIDAPDLAMERVIMFGGRPLGDFLERVELHVEAINLALADIPPERVRLHVCWGNWQGPHQDDVPVDELLPILYRAQVGALSIPLGNPRHEHETAAFKKLPLPDHMAFIPGVIDVTTNYLEHPELVANRICNAVDAAGSSPAPTAASAPSRASSSWRPTWPGPSSARWPTVPPSPAGVSGGAPPRTDVPGGGWRPWQTAREGAPPAACAWSSSAARWAACSPATCCTAPAAT